MYSPNAPARDVMALAIELRLRHPATPARTILDDLIVAHRGTPLEFGAVDPTTPFGQLVAEAFDTGMQACDWIGLLQLPDPRLHVALHEIWETEVWPNFLDAYGNRLLCATSQR